VPAGPADTVRYSRYVLSLARAALLATPSPNTWEAYNLRDVDVDVDVDGNGVGDR
jgi:hypothetical protein